MNRSITLIVAFSILVSAFLASACGNRVLIPSTTTKNTEGEAALVTDSVPDPWFIEGNIALITSTNAAYEDCLEKTAVVGIANAINTKNMKQNLAGSEFYLEVVNRKKNMTIEGARVEPDGSFDLFYTASDDLWHFIDGFSDHAVCSTAGDEITVRLMLDAQELDNLSAPLRMTEIGIRYKICEQIDFSWDYAFEPGGELGLHLRCQGVGQTTEHQGCGDSFIGNDRSCVDVN